MQGLLETALLQVAYHDFEMKVYELGKTQTLDVEKISEVWVGSLKSFFGPSIELDELDRYKWATVHHFFDMPFYVHSYCMAQLCVSTLWEAYGDAVKKGPEERKDFVQEYTNLLERGMTENMHQQFRPFDLDPEDAAFWKRGLTQIEKYIDLLENFDKKQPQIKPKTGPKKLK